MTFSHNHIGLLFTGCFRPERSEVLESGRLPSLPADPYLLVRLPDA
jgi:hypothetical protein